MTQLKQLLNKWKKNDREKQGVKQICIDLPLSVAARILALNEMFPGRNEEQLINDVLSAALYDLEELMPYQQGRTIICQDEFGDDIFEDVGPGPQFQSATNKYLHMLKQ